MNLNELAQFLVEAKINTYAKLGEAKEVILPDGNKMLEFESGAYKYIDTGLGFNPFSGKETVFYLGQPVWAMNYKSETIDPAVDAQAIYEFLKKALQLVNIGKPFRGPISFEQGNYLYSNKVDGDINRFQGQENVSVHNQVVYRLNYYGGLIK